MTKGHAFRDGGCVAQWGCDPGGESPGGFPTDGNLRPALRTHADRYFDKYRFESDPSLLAEIAEEMVPLVPPETQGLAGLELGGIPLATVLSAATGLPAFFVRKEAKKYGTERLCEGGNIGGKRLLIIEDVVTTGGQDFCSRPRTSDRRVPQWATRSA